MSIVFGTASVCLFVIIRFDLTSYNPETLTVLGNESTTQEFVESAPFFVLPYPGEHFESIN